MRGSDHRLLLRTAVGGALAGPVLVASSLSLILEHGSITTVAWREQPDHRILLNGTPLAPSDPVR